MRCAPGDVLTLAVGGAIQALRVLELAERRGPAPAARQLYEIVADETLVIKRGAP